MRWAIRTICGDGNEPVGEPPSNGRLMAPVFNCLNLELDHKPRLDERELATKGRVSQSPREVAVAMSRSRVSRSRRRHKDGRESNAAHGDLVGINRH
jgi:hypothetical protein